jgi:hypothetical protein
MGKSTSEMRLCAHPENSAISLHLYSEGLLSDTQSNAARKSKLLSPLALKSSAIQNMSGDSGMLL